MYPVKILSKVVKIFMYLGCKVVKVTHNRIPIQFQHFPVANNLFCLSANSKRVKFSSFKHFCLRGISQHFRLLRIFYSKCHVTNSTYKAFTNFCPSSLNINMQIDETSSVCNDNICLFAHYRSFRCRSDLFQDPNNYYIPRYIGASFRFREIIY